MQPLDVATARRCNHWTVQPLDTDPLYKDTAALVCLKTSMTQFHPHAAELTKFPSISNPRLEIDGIYMITLEPYVPAFRF